MKKILGMGNAVLDVLVKTSDEYLEKNNLLKGTMTIVEEAESKKLLEKIVAIKKDSGGSIANTMVGISELGLKANFCGKVKDDLLGQEFVENIENSGVSFLCNKSTIGLSTARCIVLVTPDGERTMQTFLGASTTLEPKDIKESFFDETSFLLIEGYLWSSPTARASVLKAIDIAKDKNVKIVFSLSDNTLVEMYKNDFSKLITNIDVLIGNEREFKSLIGIDDKKEILKTIASNVKTSVMTLGDKGAIACHNDEIISTNSCTISKVIDTTGAGDMFASGFMCKFFNDSSIKESLQFGCKTASKIIGQYGARPDSDLFKGLV